MKKSKQNEVKVDNKILVSQIIWAVTYSGMVWELGRRWLIELRRKEALDKAF